MLALEQMIKSDKYNKKIHIQLNAKVTQLFTTNNGDQISLIGIAYQDLQSKQVVELKPIKALILASGGFAADRQLLQQVCNGVFCITI